MLGDVLYALNGLVDDIDAFRSTYCLELSEKTGPQGMPLFTARMQQSALEENAFFSASYSCLLPYKIQHTIRRWTRLWNEKLSSPSSLLESEGQETAYGEILRNSVLHGIRPDLDALRIRKPFEETEAFRLTMQEITECVRPVPPVADNTPPRPVYLEPEVKLSQVLLFRRGKIIRNYEEQYEKKLRTWEKIVERIGHNLEERKKIYEQDCEKYEGRVKYLEKVLEEKKKVYQEQVQSHHSELDRLVQHFAEGRKEAVEGFLDLLLWQSPYPQGFPIQTSLDFDAETRILHVQYLLPSPDVVHLYRAPKREADAIQKSHGTDGDGAFNRLYSDIIHQIMIRVHHELYTGDSSRHLQGIALDGQVQHLNLATGQMEKICIARLKTTRQVFDQLNLQRIDPALCYRYLGGIGSRPFSALQSLDELGIRPIMGSRNILRINAQQPPQRGVLDMETSEQKLVDLFEDAFQMEQGTLELIRKRDDGLTEYSGQDPNPITGGRFILHVKTGTQPIGITVTRELFAAVVSEEAVRGILVAQGELTEEAQDFIRNKPLFMLNGKKLKQVFAERMQD